MLTGFHTGNRTVTGDIAAAFILLRLGIPPQDKLSDPNLRRANLALVRVGWLIGQGEKRKRGPQDHLLHRVTNDTPAAKVWRHRQRTLYASLKWDTVVAAVDAAQRLLPDDYKDFDSFQTKLVKLTNLPLLISPPCARG